MEVRDDEEAGVGRLRKAREYVEEAGSRHPAPAPRAEPSLARDALLLAIDPESGKPWNGARFVVPGALLAELVHEGRLDVSGTGKKVRVTVRDATPLGVEELDDALVAVGSGVAGDKVRRLLGYVPSTDELLKRLVGEGLVAEESERRLGLFPVRRYRPAPAAGRDALAARVRSVLTGEAVPDARTALLVSVLVGVHLKLFVAKQELKEAYRRLDEVRGRLPDAERAVVEAVGEALLSENDYDSST